MGKKWHVNCGGIVKYQKPMFNAHFGQAGFCTKCETFPLLQEEIMFEIDDQNIELFDDNKNSGWKIINKNQLEEKLM